MSHQGVVARFAVRVVQRALAVADLIAFRLLELVILVIRDPFERRIAVSTERGVFTENQGIADRHAVAVRLNDEGAGGVSVGVDGSRAGIPSHVANSRGGDARRGGGQTGGCAVDGQLVAIVCAIAVEAPLASICTRKVVNDDIAIRRVGGSSLILGEEVVVVAEVPEVERTGEGSASSIAPAGDVDDCGSSGNRIAKECLGQQRRSNRAVAIVVNRQVRNDNMSVPVEMLACEERTITPIGASNGTIDATANTSCIRQAGAEVIQSRVAADIEVTLNFLLSVGLNHGRFSATALEYFASGLDDGLVHNVCALESGYAGLVATEKLIGDDRLAAEHHHQVVLLGETLVGAQLFGDDVVQLNGSQHPVLVIQAGRVTAQVDLQFEGSEFQGFFAATQGLGPEGGAAAQRGRDRENNLVSTSLFEVVLANDGFSAAFRTFHLGEQIHPVRRLDGFSRPDFLTRIGVLCKQVREGRDSKVIDCHFISPFRRRILDAFNDLALARPSQLGAYRYLEEPTGHPKTPLPMFLVQRL